MNKNNIILKKHGRLIRHLWREVYGGCGLENDIDDNELTIECPNGMDILTLFYLMPDSTWEYTALIPVAKRITNQ